MKIRNDRDAHAHMALYEHRYIYKPEPIQRKAWWMRFCWGCLIKVLVLGFIAWHVGGWLKPFADYLRGV